MKKSEAISDRTWQGQQSWNREIIENIEGRRVRLTVKVDAYDFQSYGRAELWNGSEWKKVHSIPGQQLSAFKKVSYVSRSCPPTSFDNDLNELRAVTKGVL